MKKIISFVLCLLMLSSSLLFFVSARGEDNFSFGYASFVNDDPYTLGDANADGSINAIDSYCMKASVAGIDGYCDTVCTDAADLYADGKVTAVDVLYLKSVLAGQTDLYELDSNNRIYSLNIGGVSISQFDIVLPEGTTYDDNIYFSYELLKNYTKLATGVTLQKAYGTSKTGHGIYYHDVTGTELGDKFGDDGFKYEVIDGNLHIYGTLRGNMYATYDIIEDYLGFLFYDNVYTLTTKSRYTDIPEATVNEEIPGFTFRFVHSTAWGSTFERTTLPRRINAASLLGGDKDSYYGYSQGSRFLNAHSYWYYYPMGSGEMPPEGTLNENGVPMTLYERYQQKYLNGGGSPVVIDNGAQPCATSTDVFDILYQGLLDTIEMCKANGTDMLICEGITTPSFSMNDSTLFCTCRLCKAIATGTVAKRISQETADEIASWYSGDCEYNPSTKELSFKKEGYFALYVALANRAADKIQEIYPGAKIETLVYGCNIPESIKPSGNLAMDYCGAISGCVNHRLGEHKCVITGAVKDDPNFHSVVDDEAAVEYWLGEGKKAGATMCYGIYASDNFAFYLFDIPTYFDLYYNIKWLYEHGVDGTGDDSPNTANGFNGFESLKAKLFAELEWNPTMTFEEYTGVIKKYLKAIYGYGYEHVYNYLVELCNANEAVTVCVPMYASAFDLYSKSYVAEHYEYMRNELLLAKQEQGSIGKSCHTNLDKLFMTCEALGLSASYDKMYTNGTPESRAEYEKRYTDLYNYIKNNNIVISSEPTLTLPSTISFDKSPFIQFYKTEHRYIANGYYSE